MVNKFKRLKNHLNALKKNINVDHVHVIFEKKTSQVHLSFTKYNILTRWFYFSFIFKLVLYLF